MRGGQIVPINSLETTVYVNLSVVGSTITVNNITNNLVKSIATTTPGSLILSVDPSLNTLKDYTLFGYNGTTTTTGKTATWVEIPRMNIDSGGNTVALYGNVQGMIIRKQGSSVGEETSIEVSIPVPVATYGNIMQFVNISDSIFGFTLTSSAATYNSNMYIKLSFISQYATTGTKLSGWLPTYIDGLALWLNASEPGLGTSTPNTGVPITNWTDKSGQNNHATASGSTIPIYQFLTGGPGMGMYFNGSSYFSGNMKNTGTYSYTFAVARPDVSNPSSGRLLSLSAPNTDDSLAKTYMGVSASAGGTIPTTKRMVMGLGNAATNKIIYSDDNGTTWTAANSSWSASGSCSSIAYNGYMFVAVGDDGTTNGVIKYSYNGSTWTSSTLPPNCFFYNSTNTTGGIKVVMYTGTMWVCGGAGGAANAPIPALAYSYDGITWLKNTTTLPFTGSGDCIRTISTNGTLIILSGFLTPSMSYSYDGINWSNLPQGAYAATQIPGAAANTGVHSLLWHPAYKLWIAGGDGGNPSGNITTADGYKKISMSFNGFDWTALDSNTQGQWPVSGSYMNITRVFSTYSGVNTPTIICSGPLGSNNSGTSTQNYGPLMSMPQTPISSYPYGFYFVHASNSTGNLFPVTSGSTNETSAVYWNGTNLMYGLQQSPWFVYNADRNGFTTPSISLINGPVNAIVDNTNPNPNFNANIYQNAKTTTTGVKDTINPIPYIVSAWADGNNTCVAINGTATPANTINPSQFNITGYNVGKNIGTTYNNYRGYIYEILNYNGYIFANARRVIEGYLAWKWSVNIYLPSTHPFYSHAPTKSSITKPWPKFFSDLQPAIWLDGQDPNGTESFSPADRTLISTWYDKSGNGNDLTAPPGSEPMFRNNVITAGGLQFNRYAYQSMSLIPVPLATDKLLNFTAPTTTNNVPISTPWIPGLGGFVFAGGWKLPTAIDNYGFLYIATAITASNMAAIIQYDEVNNQTRMIYKYTGFTSVGNGFSSAIVIGSITGYIYCVMTQNGAFNNMLVVLKPDSLPITANTKYTSFTPTIQNPDGTSLASDRGLDCLVVDKNENLYISKQGAIQNMFYRFPLSSYTNTAWKYDITLAAANLIGYQSIWAAYSPKENSISWAATAQNATYGHRKVIYLDKCANCIGGTSGTTLTVSSMIAGSSPIQIGTTFCYVPSGASTNPTIYYYYTVSAFVTNTAGGTGGIGQYTITRSNTTNVTMIDVPIGTRLTETYIQIGSGNANSITPDGLFNASLAIDPTGTGNIFYQYVGGSAQWPYDPIGNYIYINAGDQNGGVRLKRINLSTRQMTTIAGAVNQITYNISPTYLTLTSERFPVVYDVGSTYDSPYVSPITIGQANTNIIGKNAVYHLLTTTNGNTTFGQVAKITNPRATSSCMSGSLSLTGSAVSVFIVYLNKNASKNIMPMGAKLQSPIISLSSNTDFVTFVGGIAGTILTVTAVNSGTIQLNATMNTPLGGFISSYGTATSASPIGTYNVSIAQIVAPGTTITASNGIDVVNNTVASTTGANLSNDTSSSSYISVYASGSVSVGTTTSVGGTATSVGTATIYRNSISNVASTSLPPTNWPTNGLDTTVQIQPDMLFYSSTATAINSKLNGGTTSTTVGTFTPFNVSAIGLGIQPANASRKESLLPNYFFDGVICEVIVYNTDMSTDPYRLALMEGYLAWKWGLANKLPNSHMYRYSAPTDFNPTTPVAITSIIVTNITDSGCAVSWSGGNNAVSYSYTVLTTSTSTTSTSSPATLAITDNGTVSNSAKIAGLSMNTSYTLTITANGTLSSTTSTTTFKTLTYVGTLWAGSTTATGQVDTLTSPATNARFNLGDILVVDMYGYVYFWEGAGGGWAGIRVIAPNGTVQTICKTGPVLPTNSPTRSKAAINPNTGLILHMDVGFAYLFTPSDFPMKFNNLNVLTTTWTVTKFSATGGVSMNLPSSSNDTRGIFNPAPDFSTFYIYENYSYYIRKITLNFSTNIGTATNVFKCPTDTVYNSVADSVNVYMATGSGGSIYIYNLLTGNSYYVTGTGTSGSYVYSAGASVINSLGINVMTMDSFGNLYLLAAGSLRRVVLMGIDKSNQFAVCTAIINALNSTKFISNLSSDNPTITTLVSGSANYIGFGVTMASIGFDGNNSIYISSNTGSNYYIIKFTLQ